MRWTEIFQGRCRPTRRTIIGRSWALGLSDKGTDNELTVQTEEAFKTHLGLQKNSRFSGLFQRAPGRNLTRVAEPNQGAVLRKVTSYPDTHLPANEEAQH